MPKDPPENDEKSEVASVALDADGEALDGNGDESTPQTEADTSDRENDSPEENDSPKATTVEEINRSRRRHKLASLAIVGLLLAILLLLVSGVLDSNTERPVVEIAPSVLFEQMVHEAIAEEAKTIHVEDYAVDAQMLQQIRGFESLETVILDQGVVTDEMIDIITSLPNLQQLRLRLSPIGDEGMKKIATCETLWLLNLPQANCTSEGIAALQNLKRLRQLRIGSDQLGNEVSREIAKISSLRGIHLIGVGLTDEGLKVLADLPHLESLYLDDSSVTNAGLQWLFRNEPQLHVHVNEQHHDRDPKAHAHR